MSPLPAQARPQVLVVLADHLTLSDVTRPGLPGFGLLRRRGQAALMSPGVAHGPDPVANVYATLGAGDSIRVGDVSQGRLGIALRAASVRTALIGDADGDDTGPYQPARLLLPFPDVVSDPTVPAPASPGGRRTDPARCWAQTASALRTCALVVVHFGDLSRLEREQRRGDLLPAASAMHRRRALLRLDQYLQAAVPRLTPGQRFLLVVPTPPRNARGQWDRLTPLLAEHLAPAGSLLTTDTTQTAGLVAARDLAPTLLALLRVPLPIQMTGAPLRPSGPLLLGRLSEMDRQTRLNQDAQIPLFWGLGLLAPCLIFPLLALYGLGQLTGRSRLCRVAPYAMRLLASWPLALLLAPLLHPATLSAYLAWIAAISALLALLPSPTVIFSLTALVLIGDGLTGTTLVSQSVLSSYALAGIRFYGIGNEYMGLLIGGALLAAAALIPEASRPDGPRPAPQAGPPSPKVRAFLAWERVGEQTPGLHVFPKPLPELGEGGSIASRARAVLPSRARADSGLWVVPWFALVTFVLSFPSFGAKAGGAVTATATFTLAWLRLRGVPLRARHFLIGIAGGFALVFLWAWLGDALHLRRTHLETAVGALQGGRFGYIGGIALRKIGLAGRVFLHGGTLLGLLALALMALAAHRLFRRHLAAFYAPRPRLAAVSEAGLWGCGVCVVFNDSGIVAAILLAMCLILPVLHGLFQESCASSPSMSATSESASPSVMP